MRILIGTPIHEIKDYAMERWLRNVAGLRKVYPCDFFMVDNSPNPLYVEKVKGYCAKVGITNYKIIHLELPLDQEKHERIARSREIIRTELLSKKYDAWFTWECDQIIPVNTLNKLVSIMKSENYMMVNPNKWAREFPDEPNTDFGCCLIKREALEKYGFLNAPNNWLDGEAWFKNRILNDGGNYINVYGIIKPIYHLNN